MARTMLTASKASSTQNSTTASSTAQLAGSVSGAAEKSGFKDGSIVSLKLKNFLVYKDAKAHFGPRLNMVVGPNGSGKSTLVCAIALGLGGSPKVLGRADNLSAFVMHGVKDDASVTVELHVSHGQNLHITRTFSRQSNKSTWRINSSSWTERQVKETIQKLGIQVDNLCTMLPQDKVGDFSGFTPDKLLLETEKALSHDTLYKPHCNLIELQENKGKTQNEEETMGQKLEGMELELSVLQTEVQRHEERQEKEEKLELHRKRKAWLEVERLQEMGRKAKQDEKAAKAELTAAEAADKPLQDESRHWEREVERLRGMERTRTTARVELEKAITAANGKIEKLTTGTGDVRNELHNLESRRKSDQNKLATHQNSLEQKREQRDALREKIDELPRLEELRARMQTKQSSIQDVKSDVVAVDKLISDKTFEIKSTADQIQRLNNQAAVREKKYRNRFREEGALGLQVRDWAARHPDKLKGPVVGPVGLEVTVEDTEAASAVETHIPNYIWCSVVVTCKQDHDTIIQAFQNQKVSLGILINQRGELKTINPTFSPQEMAQLNRNAGVRGFLDDFIQCPNTVRQVLRRNHKIHSVFLGSAKTQQKIAQDPEFLPSLGKKGPSGYATGSAIYAGGSYGAPQGGGGRTEPLQMYQTKISLYGARKPSVRVSETRVAQVVGPGLDSDAIAVQESRKAHLETLLAAAMAKKEKKSKILGALNDDLKELKNDHSMVGHNNNNLRTTETRIKSLEKSIEALQTKLEAGDDSVKAKLTMRYGKILEQQAASVTEAQRLAAKMLDASVEVMAAACAKRIAFDKQEDAREAVQNAQDSRTALRNKVNELRSKKEQVLKQFKAEYQKAMQKAPINVDNDEKKGLTYFGERYDELPKDANELDAVIDDLTEDLNGSHHNPQVVVKYKKLQQATESLRKDLEALKEGNANAMNTMEQIREPWKEKLQLTVKRLDDLFSEYMSKMDGCCGEVRLAETESYKKWGIEIRVRFRSEKDQGKMSVLDKRVHSGGERSVSTILYLMALQDLQSSPFRVVDEINQGMDPRNERQVFSRIVLNSCGPNRKQYFLITPKLLQGLVAMDHEDMTVIFIMNGPNCITGTDDHVMKKFIAAKKRRLALAAGDAQGGSPQQRRRIE